MGRKNGGYLHKKMKGVEKEGNYKITQFVDVERAKYSNKSIVYIRLESKLGYYDRFAMMFGGKMKFEFEGFSNFE
jgi:hypothetical protein